MKKNDERDTMFARASYKKGSPSYEDYYRKNPELQEVDDAIRAMPGLCSEGTSTFNPIISPMADAAFEFLGDIRHLSEGKPAEKKIAIDPIEITKRIKGLAQHYGAVLVGVTESKDEHFYAYRGRHEEVYGEKVENKYTHSIAIAVQMKRDMMHRSPRISEVIETSRAYVEVAMVGMVLSYYIRSLGYEARHNMDANYLVNTVAVAKDAGLGAVGRNNLLTNKKYGSMLRLGVINTNLPLVADKPVDFGLHDFCLVCKKCARDCMSKSISKEDAEHWSTTQESCYQLWRKVGTDCGVCIASCPFGQGLTTIDEVDSFANNPEAIAKTLAEYEEKFGLRPFVLEPPEWLM